MTSYPRIFVGSWVGHGRLLVVNADGSAKATYRVYVFCSQNPTPPCDQMISNQIVAGGQVTLHVGQVVTANHMSTATAVVLTSSASKIAVSEAALGELCGLDGVETDGVAETVGVPGDAS